MSGSIRTVILNGSLARPSKTRGLLDAIHAQLHTQLPLETVHIDLVDLVQDIGAHLWRDKLPATALHALQTIEGADFLILGSPVFRGSMPGLFKHLFDLIDSPAMLGKPVLLAATGGSQRHALVIEHQVRPLLAFFQTLTLPVGVYASEEDFQDGKLQSKAVTERIQLAVKTTLPVLQVQPVLVQQTNESCRFSKVDLLPQNTFQLNESGSQKPQALRLK